VRAALETLRATRSTAQTIPEAETGPLRVVRRALEDVTTHAARLDYPTFVARQLPLGSGAVESAGQSVIQARPKGAGMRWSGAGAQQVGAGRAAPLGALGDLLACPAAARPPAPVPPSAPHAPDASPTSHAGPHRQRPAAPTASAPATAPRPRSSLAPSAYRTCPLRMSRAVHYFQVHPRRPSPAPG
jgi:hypothetical protein